jgi:DNA-binding CsgD family transcriptional regulator
MRNLFTSYLIIICLFVCLFFPVNAFSNSKPDSLLIVAEGVNNSIKNRLSAYADLVFYYESRNPEMALQLGEKGLALQVPDSLSSAVALLYVNIAFVHYSAQEYNKAIPVFQEAAKYFIKAGKLKEEGIQYNNIGIMYRKLGDYSESINYQLKSLEKFDEVGFLSGEINVYINIGNIYLFQKHPELSLTYYDKAYKLSLTQTDSVLIADAVNSLANGYDHSGKKDTALHYYLIAIKEYGKYHKWVKKAKSEHNVALIYILKHDYRNAEKMLMNSMEVFKQMPSVMDIEKATVQMSLARVYGNTNRQVLAIKNFNQALVVFRKRGAKTEEEQVLRFLSKLLAEQGKFKDAYSFQSDYIRVKDTIQNQKIASEVLELTEKYEAEKKQKEILELQNKNEKAKREEWFVISLSIAVISFLIIVFILYYQYRRKETEKMKSHLKQSARELDLLRHKIASGTTQYLLPCEYSISRDDVNTYLKEALSERELDVFMLLLKGITNRDIAEKLFVSVNTVKFHLQNIYVKLDVDNRTDAILSVSNHESPEKRVLA